MVRRSDQRELPAATASDTRTQLPQASAASAIPLSEVEGFGVSLKAGSRDSFCRRSFCFGDAGAGEGAPPGSEAGCEATGGLQLRSCTSMREHPRASASRARLQS